MMKDQKIIDLDCRVVSGLKRVDASEMEEGDDDKIDGAYTPVRMTGWTR